MAEHQFLTHESVIYRGREIWQAARRCLHLPVIKPLTVGDTGSLTNP